MVDKDNTKSQIAKAADILMGLRPNVSSEDRKSAMTDLSVGAYTISMYLNGHGKDISTAEKLIVYFRAIIQRRDALLTQGD